MEWHTLLLWSDILQILGGFSDMHTLYGLGSLTSVLKVNTKIWTSWLAWFCGVFWVEWIAHHFQGSTQAAYQKSCFQNFKGNKIIQFLLSSLFSTDINYNIYIATVWHSYTIWLTMHWFRPIPFLPWSFLRRLDFLEVFPHFSDQKDKVFYQKPFLKC